MKYIILFLFVIFFFAVKSQQFVPGLNVGIVASQVDGDRLDGYNKPGVKAGVFVQNNFKTPWSFYMGLDYVQKGSRKLRNPDDPTDRYYLLRLSYIEVPLIIQYTYKEKFLGEIGLVFCYLFRAREDVDGYGFLEPEPPFKSYDFPARWGIGYKLGKSFSIKLHQSYSLLPIRNHPANQTWYFDRGQYNNYLLFTLNMNL